MTYWQLCFWKKPSQDSSACTTKLQEQQPRLYILYPYKNITANSNVRIRIYLKKETNISHSHHGGYRKTYQTRTGTAGTHRHLVCQKTVVPPHQCLRHLCKRQHRHDTSNTHFAHTAPQLSERPVGNDRRGNIYERRVINISNYARVRYSN